MSSSDGKDSFILLINIGLENAREGSTFIMSCGFAPNDICIKMFNSFSEEVIEATGGEECLKSKLIKCMDTGHSLKKCVFRLDSRFPEYNISHCV